MVYLNDHIADFDWEKALSLLSEQRREQTLKFKYELGRKTCAGAYLLLCEGLKKEYGITEKPLFNYGPHGKPALRDYPDIHFNLSHCRDAVVCAISNRPVGVDVESVSHYKESVAHYTMSQQEMHQILHADRPDVMFTRLWTMKEAVLKLSGEGLRDNLKEVLADVDRLNIQTIVSEDERYVYSEARGKE
jgi:4'-phosphopantetheinyl transferase